MKVKGPNGIVYDWPESLAQSITRHKGVELVTEEPVKAEPSTEEDSTALVLPEGWDEWTVAQIDAFATQEGIEFEDGSNKGEKLEQLRALAEPSTEEE